MLCNFYKPQTLTVTQVSHERQLILKKYRKDFRGRDLEDRSKPISIYKMLI